MVLLSIKYNKFDVPINIKSNSITFKYHSPHKMKVTTYYLKSEIKNYKSNRKKSNHKYSLIYKVIVIRQYQLDKP